MLSLSLVGASFLCLQKNDQRFFPSPRPVVPASSGPTGGTLEDRHWGIVVAETTNCVFVAFLSPLPSPSACCSGKNSASPAETAAPLPETQTYSVQRFVKEACVFAISSRDGARALANPTPPDSSTPAPVAAGAFPVCVVHGRQHLPHLRHNHSSRLLAD
jgi:hypothetical protein